ncbi:hypothetical protein [Burkholderia ambifaria]|uniref:hypothetical protein n=1 Tax=Burkholderia ambifaria TaxID=152480 RepID=UPI00158AE462|nr:hypothetical protein [Burkholderia ambifaria]
MRFPNRIFVVSYLTLQAISASADDNADKIKSLNDQTNLITAQQQLDKANLDAISTQNDLKKAKAETEKLDAQIATDNISAQNDLDKAKLASRTATLAAAKTAFGDAPTIGKDGNIQISDSTSGQLLVVKAGSLNVTASLAKEVCRRLQDAGITSAAIVPVDLNTKLQAGALEVDEFQDVVKSINDASGAGVQAQFAPLAILSALSLARYGADSVAQLARLMRSDLNVGLSQTSREGSLAALVSAQCPGTVPRVNIEDAARSLALTVMRKGIQSMATFAASYEPRKKALTDQLAATKAQMAHRTKRNSNTDVSRLQQTFTDQQKDLNEWLGYQPLVARIDALTKSIAAKPQEYLDALTWGQFSPPGELSTWTRLTLILTTQDAQIIKDNFLLGKRLYGVSSGELIYSAVDRDGRVLATGFVTASDAIGKINIEASRPMQGFAAPVANVANAGAGGQ